jgi:hypothetical protein
LRRAIRRSAAEPMKAFAEFQCARYYNTPVVKLPADLPGDGADGGQYVK